MQTGVNSNRQLGSSPPMVFTLGLPICCAPQYLANQRKLFRYQLSKIHQNSGICTLISKTVRGNAPKPHLGMGRQIPPHAPPLIAPAFGPSIVPCLSFSPPIIYASLRLLVRYTVKLPGKKVTQEEIIHSYRCFV